MCEYSQLSVFYLPKQKIKFPISGCLVSLSVDGSLRVSLLRCFDHSLRHTVNLRFGDWLITILCRTLSSSLRDGRLALYALIPATMILLFDVSLFFEDLFDVIRCRLIIS